MPDPTLLSRGKVEGQAIGGAGGTFVLDIICQDRDALTVECKMTGAANGDLAISATPFEADGLTPMAIPLPAPVAPDLAGPTFAGGVVSEVARFKVTGFDKVRVTITNNNAGGQTIQRVSWKLT